MKDNKENNQSSPISNFVLIGGFFFFLFFVVVVVTASRHFLFSNCKNSHLTCTLYLVLDWTSIRIYSSSISENSIKNFSVCHLFILVYKHQFMIWNIPDVIASFLLLRIVERVFVLQASSSFSLSPESYLSFSSVIFVIQVIFVHQATHAESLFVISRLYQSVFFKQTV